VREIHPVQDGAADYAMLRSGDRLLMVAALLMQSTTGLSALSRHPPDRSHCGLQVL
jgi:hypothetical protein